MGGMTIAEKILATHAGKEEVKPGEIVLAKVDFMFGNDVTTPLAIKTFRKIGVEKVFDPERIAIVLDHFTPNKDIKAAEQCKFSREFAREQGIKWFFEGGNVGVEHCLLPELGLVLPGELIIGADSHTCTYGALGAFATGVGSTDLAVAMATGEAWFRVPETIKFVYEGDLQPWVTSKDLILYTIGDIGVNGALYKVMEFSGEVIEKLSVEQRMTMTNMAIEAGAKTGIIEPDKKTIEYVKGRAKREYKIYKSDEDAKYYKVIEYDVSKIEPQVAFPHLPENTVPISKAAKMNIKIDQVVIGSCTNGRLEDLRMAAEVLEGQKVAPWVRLIILPCSPTVYFKAMKEGLLEIFLEAGAVIGPPTCGPCLGGHMGILASGERAVSTTNRNFVGRMGHPKSEVYLASPYVAAASAILGRIASPEEVVK
ncbi:3-isopropylmalate dehydratase large subunit [Pyrococcus furiosus DSM 3638]|uniref:3-isopropylmalate dehydratase large subunit 1 n=3 Tax=Pyrococcus furiosus TaxID=2261 RepID=LEUC1_PYRFU|nr:MULTISPECIES: 3-isopropylmalate dehydratase large subunit [Pyrococcus]Q8U2A1.1 RecName: Full=3-isopropylmalate dehydratase large subunit 1; AltName: Full=Alpha-IPM isomerase 1; Short=IPMI 1; AltName: Full=Isopropylmalate isomerase 1 [Pyrococcus furiosus DSM 3638]AAL81062.1 3-isopropylmalate dehydratase large subunit [Pyrococcus furiosus DSM 3638]MDK2869721.1 3-isopropylmalate/(R)-2-methylmalate dehydratase large subunit [Pyrococcus sp.]QEK78604.1 3-isopropylmalate dehydratase large subunit [